MYFRLVPQKAEPNSSRVAAFWLRDDRDQIISFRDRDAAVHFRRMVEKSENYLRATPAFQSAILDTPLCEFDNNGYVIQLTIPRNLVPKSTVILLSPGRP